MLYHIELAQAIKSIRQTIRDGSVERDHCYRGHKTHTNASNAESLPFFNERTNLQLLRKNRVSARGVADVALAVV